jgi:hypothetical protein
MHTYIHTPTHTHTHKHTHTHTSGLVKKGSTASSPYNHTADDGMNIRAPDENDDGVTGVLQWRHNGVTEVLKWCYSGVVVVVK